VLDRVLANRTWLVGEKGTYTDLAFVIWNSSIDYALGGRTDGMGRVSQFQEVAGSDAEQGKY